MKPLMRFTNAEKLLVERPSGKLHLACECVEILRGPERHLVKAYDLFAPDTLELDPRVVGEIELPMSESCLCMMDDPQTIAEAVEAVIILGDATVTVSPRAGEFVRTDRWFGKTLSPDEERLARAIRANQFALTFFERNAAELGGEKMGKHVASLARRIAHRLAQLSARSGDRNRVPENVSGK